ncbi:N-acetylglucosaminyl-phosphatidylinositol de-N-acetylase-like [Watersipora subatra]|uniref:N-acetylglucosaminyl-phosphatidylinositol de-N-acetylase-like n=1 Tax=Watersipora subatra TaxID=2589382 RepID=UPI00355BFCCA
MSITVYFFGGVLLLVAIIWRVRTKKWTLYQQASVLIVTAHPDDETMFFGPVICSLLDAGVDVHIQCLSIGDACGQGSIRKQEFYASCQVLGVDNSRCYLYNDPKDLPDSMTAAWNEQLIQNVVSETIQRLNITAVLTFDEYGISGHANHISVYRAVRDLQLTSVSRYKLSTVNLLRKYCSIFDVVLSCFLNENVLLTPITYIAIPFKAMFKHRSQLMWFRYLYLMFSRYMFLNNIDEIVSKYE